MNSPSSSAIWHDRTPLLVLGTGIALPGDPIVTEELLTTVDRRFALSLRRPGLAIAHKLGIRTRHLCRDMARRLEAPGKDIATLHSLPLPCGPRYAKPAWWRRIFPISSATLRHRLA
jgi:hypothetical protein